MNRIVEKHQVAGLDDRERGFSRLAEIEERGHSFWAVFRYETVMVQTDGHATSGSALSQLIELLQERGYRQLRSRLNFRGDEYLGSQEAWIEYADHEPSRGWWRTGGLREQLARRTGWIAKLLNLARRD